MTNSKRVRHIFTYGTLMSNAEGDMGAAERALMSEQARCLGTARIRGAMYHAGACPGVVVGGGKADVVYGELWQLPVDVVALLAALDSYEGCAMHSPSPHSYERRRIRVWTSEGRRVTAWIYEWVGATDGLPRITDGRWRGVSRPPSIGEIIGEAARQAVV